MWKPTNQPATPGRPAEPERPSATVPAAPVPSNEPAAQPRPVRHDHYFGPGHDWQVPGYQGRSDWF